VQLPVLCFGNDMCILSSRDLNLAPFELFNCHFSVNAFCSQYTLDRKVLKFPVIS